MPSLQFGRNWSSNLQFIACAFLIVGVCCSKFLMSMGLLIGGISFFTSGEVISSTKRLFKNPYFQLLFGFYTLHLLGLLWSENLAYGWNDVRQKSSLVIIPIIVLHRNDWSQIKINRLLYLFLAALGISSLVNFTAFYFFREELNLVDIRSMSLFESHIRFGILIGLGTGVTLYFIKGKPKNFYLLISLISWFGFYSYYSQVLSGIISFIIFLFIYTLIQLRPYRVWFYSLLILPGLITFALIYYLQLPLTHPNPETAAQSEMESTWKIKSDVPYNGLDAKKQQLKNTLIRYLHSKSLPLNSEGVNKLSDQDIKNIETGYADIRETQSGIPARLFAMRFELQNPQDPNAHPLTERIELWSNAWYTIQKSPIGGVGNGDVKDALQASYIERDSKLTQERRLNAHQSYLTFWLSFGIIGLLSFLWIQGYFLKQAFNKSHFLALSFGLVALITFLFEDTLETQAGITFFVFFYSLFSVHLDKTQLK